jgi:hypothetical protein
LKSSIQKHSGAEDSDGGVKAAFVTLHEGTLIKREEFTCHKQVNSLQRGTCQRSSVFAPAGSTI